MHRLKNRTRLCDQARAPCTGAGYGSPGASPAADPAQTIMAFTWGDGWTNQIQPFWALPLLGVAGLSARDIIGYLLIWLALSGVAIGGTFVVVSMLT